jgi:hypothetical protein
MPQIMPTALVPANYCLTVPHIKIIQQSVYKMAQIPATPNDIEIG